MGTTLDMREGPCQTLWESEPTTLGTMTYEGFWASSGTLGIVVDDDRIAGNPINHTDPSGLYSVSIVIYVDTADRPPEFNRAQTEAQIRTMFAAVHPPHGNTFTISLVDNAASSINEKEDLGFKYDKPGFWDTENNWEMLGISPAAALTVKTYRACTKRVQQYSGLVVWSSGPLFGRTHGYKSEINGPLIGQRAQEQGTTPIWPVLFANAIAHEQIYHGLMDYYFHYGSDGELSYEATRVRTLETIPTWFADKFIKDIELNKP